LHCLHRLRFIDAALRRGTQLPSMIPGNPRL
jgi:hypothetical protein